MRWWQFRRRRHCPHVTLRGIYGDEINHTPGFRRNQCLDCSRLLDGPVSISVDRSGGGRNAPPAEPPRTIRLRAQGYPMPKVGDTVQIHIGNSWRVDAKVFASGRDNR